MKRTICLSLNNLTFDYLHAETVCDIDKIKDTVIVIENSLREM